MDEGPLDNLLMVIIGAIALNAMRYDPVPFGDAATLAFAGLPALMIGLGLFNLARAVLKRPSGVAQGRMRRTVEGNRNHREREGKPARARKKQQAKHTRAQADLGYMYTWDDWSDDWVLNPAHWSSHRITKITKKRIFVHDKGERQLSFDRATVERDGYILHGRQSTAAKYFYSESGKAAQEAQWAQMRKETVRASLGEHGDLLGLGAEFTRDDVMRAFRQKAHEHHPDKGGDAEIFRRLVEARDSALRTAA
jgi:hypothetical protein